jgi:hypothetical protein
MNLSKTNAARGLPKHGTATRMRHAPILAALPSERFRYLVLERGRRDSTKVVIRTQWLLGNGASGEL